MQIHRIALLPALLLGISCNAWGRDVVVEVDSASGPWDVESNKALMPYGAGDHRQPTLVPLDIAAGKIGIYAEGITEAYDMKAVGPAGIADDPVDDRIGAKRRRYPSFYTPKILYPANRHGLVVIFVDKKGVNVSRPIMVGSGVKIAIPEGAEGISLGFNDVIFTGNSGKLKVTLKIPDD